MAFINDQHYINQIIEGNTNAFSVLVNQYKDLVFTLAYKMLKNKEEAEEVIDGETENGENTAETSEETNETQE